jgi:hypothetical protein
MELSEVCQLVAEQLPDKYEPGLLTFYHQGCRPRDDYVVIGDDYGTELCVRLSDGAVYSIDPEGSLPTRFMNSGIRQLAKFISIYDAGRAETPTEPGWREAQRLRNEMAAIDPKAVEDTENWWSSLLNQVENEEL